MKVIVRCIDQYARENKTTESEFDEVVVVVEESITSTNKHDK